MIYRVVGFCDEFGFFVFAAKSGIFFLSLLQRLVWNLISLGFV
jgi:hypothetical protein